VISESVDLVEVNHFYDEHGRLVFDQTIFYDWQRYKIEGTPGALERDEAQTASGGPSQEFGYRFQVRAWRLIKNPQTQLPYRNWRQGGYTCGPWQDGETLRIVHARGFRETWTQYDPELVEREWLPKEKRKELRVKPPPKGKKVATTISVAPMGDAGHCEVCPAPPPDK
jgi:hypothetical protein